MAQLDHLQIFIVRNGIPFGLVEVSQKLEHKKASFVVILAMLHNLTDVGIVFKKLKGGGFNEKSPIVTLTECVLQMYFKKRQKQS